MRHWIPLLLLALGAAATTGRAQLISRDVPAAAVVERGRQAYVISCAGCHGIDARGDSGPDLIRSEMMLNDEGGDLLGPFLQAGRSDEGMPAFQFPADEVAELAAFIRAQSQAVINRGLYEIQNVVTGDAERGRAYFNGAGGCSGCHSPTRDLAGIGRRFDPPALLSRLIYPGRGGRGRGGPLPREVTVTLADGRQVEGRLEDIDDFSVALRTDDGTYRSFTRRGIDVEVRDPYQAHIDLLGRYTDRDLHDLVTYLVTLQ